MFQRVCLLCAVSRPYISSQIPQSRCLQKRLFSSYESYYALNRIYRGSDEDITKPLDTPPSDLYKRLQQQSADESDIFSGYIPVDKVNIKFSKSSGPGGQNVNKVESKVEMRFHVASAEWLPESVRELIQEKKKTKVNAKGELVIVSQKTRSQMKNVQDCLLKLRELIHEVQRKPKEPDEKSRAVWRMRQEKSTRERLKQKTLHANTKRDRKVFADSD
ncbi:Peptidyl-tRNA hydrolase ICT1, mitochondrial [Holothuria leucospilota]|uniref:Large ribosomal subunit protein mL62 n=1 Tax=Holothuria leucospilota TaxID=206669 RepID=A0A9Q1C1F7_HOLLE|nr:Peptidyl-tRNA hydrolase ICT1, mitochondrial [Holothuria leucospilota]